MSANPDKQIFEAASGAGCFALVLGLILLPPLILPALILMGLFSLAGGTAMHPAVIILVAVFSAWGLYRLIGILIRAVPPSWARASTALYVGVCYTFAIFQRELTTARSELDVTWLVFTLLIFLAFGWKAAGMIVNKAHRDQMIRKGL